MSLSINTNSGVLTNTDTAVAVKAAGIAKDQLEKEGQMALELIASVPIGTGLPAPTQSSGNTINIKV